MPRKHPPEIVRTEEPPILLVGGTNSSEHLNKIGYPVDLVPVTAAEARRQLITN